MKYIYVYIWPKRNDSLLPTKEPGALRDLACLLGEHDRRTVTLWALNLAAETVEVPEGKYLEEMRLRDALGASHAVVCGILHITYIDIRGGTVLTFPFFCVKIYSKCRASIR